MVFAGDSRSDGAVAIGPTAAEEMLSVACDEQVAGDRAEWLMVAQSRSDCTFFGIRERGVVVGQIFLHDRDDDRSETLIGYHIFRSADRGRGIGTASLLLLRDWTMQQTALARLVVITSEANTASQRTAEKAGFRFIGRPHEDPVNGRVYEFLR